MRTSSGRRDEPVDLLVIGGGITGAGIALEAARRGLSVRLVEARDYASGTSSRSSKLVHGGLRYLREGAIGLTRESVHERDRLLHDAPGLVEPQRFLMAHHVGRSPGRRTMALGLAVYDHLAGRRTREPLDASDTLRAVPGLDAHGLQGASTYLDARTDDARLVLRVLQEARDRGARTSARCRVDALLRDEAGEVVGARLVPTLTDDRGEDRDGEPVDQPARVVVNATGAWGDRLRAGLDAAPMLRPLRGSHLMFPLWRLPVAMSVGLYHPRDRRPVFVTPWEGVALVGTTDLDHREDLDHEPAITTDEADYLLEAVRATFPSLDLALDDALGSFAGVRPVVGGGAADPSRESREHAVEVERGLVTVTGGKLTTFRVIALDALARCADRLPRLSDLADRGGRQRAQAARVFDPVAPGPALRRLPVPSAQRLLGRFGREAEALVAAAPEAARQAVAGTTTTWAELLWSARHESVRHLDDLLLRRTRLGLVLRDGGLHELDGWAPRLREALDWSTGRWAAEAARYRRVIERHYRVPGRALPEAAVDEPDAPIVDSLPPAVAAAASIAP